MAEANITGEVVGFEVVAPVGTTMNEQPMGEHERMLHETIRLLRAGFHRAAIDQAVDFVNSLALARGVNARARSC